MCECVFFPIKITSMRIFLFIIVTVNRNIRFIYRYIYLYYILTLYAVQIKKKRFGFLVYPHILHHSFLLRLLEHLPTSFFLFIRMTLVEEKCLSIAVFMIYQCLYASRQHKTCSLKNENWGEIVIYTFGNFYAQVILFQ